MIASLFALTANNQLLMAIVQPEYSPLFVAGVVLYLMRRFGTSPLLWAMLVASWIFAVNDVRIDIGGQKVDPARPLIAYLVLAGFYLVMTAAALGWLSWLRWRGLVVIGALTYPLYLTHFYVSNTIMLRLHGRLPNAAVVALTLAAILVIAYLIHLFVERPVARLIRKGLRQSFAKMRGSEPRPRDQAA
jgi:peptidoglycan/LPS O-acetylase OafA/YrhL